MSAWKIMVLTEIFIYEFLTLRSQSEMTRVGA